MTADDLPARLFREFGAGDDHLARHNLYQWLQRIARDRPEALLVISATAIEARSKTRPDRWFAASVSRRLREQGMLPSPVPLRLKRAE